MDLFHHKMLKASLLSRFRIPFNLSRLFLDFFTIEIVEMRLARCQSGKLQISNIINLSGVFEDCRHIRSHISLSICNTNDHWTVFSSHPDLTRIIPEHQLQRIRTTDTHHCLCDCIHRTKIILSVIIIHQLNHNFRICLTIKSIAML